jgi:hypothetical protein
MESMKPEKQQVVQGDLFEPKPAMEAAGKTNTDVTEEEWKELNELPKDYNATGNWR